MDRERWQQVDTILKSALELPSGDRAAFIDKACASDAELRQEVESLIRHDEADSFLAAPASEEATRLLAESEAGSLSGQTIGPYKVLRKLGAGGMGEVYLALHARTNRQVALKVLPAFHTEDKERVQRFQQEARAVLALNHPNIVTIYDIEQSGDANIIASEFIEGETLRRHLARSPLRFQEALDIAIQIAAALAAAHQAGVIHRDIKPENVMLRPDGYVKVLDFGLAKLTDRMEAASNSEAPTVAQVNTEPGLVMGTVAYMSPEQARGKVVDERTDIFSFGVLLYEMLTGHLPFEGETKVDVMAAIIQKEPPLLARYWAQAPDALEWIVARALTKDREERYQTARELLADLKRLKRRLEYEAEVERSATGPIADEKLIDRSVVGSARSSSEIGGSTAESSTTPAMSSAEYIVREIKTHRRGIILAVAALVLALVGVIVGLKYFAGSRPPVQPAAPFSRIKVSRLTTAGRASQAAISPDGEYVVHVTGGSGQQSLQLRHIDTGSDKEIVPPSKEDFSALVFSRDGGYIYYLKYSDVLGGVLSQVPVLGGTPRVLGKDVDGFPAFSPDGTQFAFIRGLPVENETTLTIANLQDGSERKLVTSKPEDMFAESSVGTWGPAWSPNGTAIAFALRTADENGSQYWRVVLARVTDGAQTPITTEKWSLIGQIAWLPDGSGMLVAAADQEPGSPRQLWHVSYPEGSVRKLTNDLNNYNGISLTRDGSALVTVQTEGRAGMWIAQRGEASRATQLPSDKNDGMSAVLWTPDGRIVYTSTINGDADIWIMDADGNNRKQLTFTNSSDVRPTLSPDGRYIIFVSDREGESNIWRMDLDGGHLKQLTHGNNDSHPTCSPDGQSVVYSSDISGRRLLWKVPIDGGNPAQVTDYRSSVPVVSPDGKFIACAYIDDVERRYMTAVIPFSGGQPLKKFEFPRPFQQEIRWTPDSRALTFVITKGGVSNIWQQPLDGGEPFPLTDFRTDTIFRYDWSRDGKTLVLSRGPVISDVVLISEFK